MRITTDAIIITESKKTSHVFYFNGDVFMGEIEKDVPLNGVMYKYQTTMFIPMVVGSGRVESIYKVPRMVQERDGYKYFCMKWRLCWNK